MGLIMQVVGAVGENGLIGVNNRLPWRILEDLALFKRVTSGHGQACSVVMGRKTWQSLPGSLPDRLMIMLTSEPDAYVGNCLTVRRMSDAFGLASRYSRLLSFIGGRKVFDDALGFVSHENTQVSIAHVTRVLRHDEVPAGAEAVYTSSFEASSLRGRGFTLNESHRLSKDAVYEKWVRPQTVT